MIKVTFVALVLFLSTMASATTKDSIWLHCLGCSAKTMTNIAQASPTDARFVFVVDDELKTVAYKVSHAHLTPDGKPSASQVPLSAEEAEHKQQLLEVIDIAKAAVESLPKTISVEQLE